MVPDTTVICGRMFLHKDMFSRFEKEGILNKKTGMDYRKIILAQGATKDEMQIIEEFLGRPTNQDAFLRSIGFGGEVSKLVR
jgi:Zn-dependent oligopeptidase